MAFHLAHPPLTAEQRAAVDNQWGNKELTKILEGPLLAGCALDRGRPNRPWLCTHNFYGGVHGPDPMA